MGFRSFFKKKKKEVQKGVNDVENMVMNEIQLEKMDQSFTAEKAELEDANKGPGKTNHLQTKEDIHSENGPSSKSDSAVSRSILNEVTVNIDSELLRKAQAKGIDLSNTLEQQLKRMVAGA